MTTLGIVGLGHMGGNMAARFLAAGYTVYGEARHRESAQELEGQGLEWRDTPRELAEAADVVLSSLPADEVLTFARAAGYEHRDLASLFEVLARLTDRP